MPVATNAFPILRRILLISRACNTKIHANVVAWWIYTVLHSGYLETFTAFVFLWLTSWDYH